LPDKQKRFVEIMRKCQWTKTPHEPAWVPYSLLVEIGGALDASADEQDAVLTRARRAARLDYILPVFFASVTALLGSTVLVYGSYAVDPAFADVSLMFDGPFNPQNVKAGIGICADVTEDCTRQVRTLQRLQVSMFAFLGAYIWSLSYIMRRLNVIDLDSNTYYNVGLRIILANFVAVVFYLALEDYVLANLAGWIPAIAFVVGWFPIRAFQFLKEKVFSLFHFRSQEARALPLEMIQGTELFQRTRLSEAGIDDAENLANANLLELLIRTPFNPRLLIDWIGQAKLYLLFRDKIYTLREARVRSIFDFDKAMSDQDAQANLFSLVEKLPQQEDAKEKKITKISKEELLVAWSSCKGDKDLAWLESAKCCLLGLEK
jgi:hypothetical protein